ncbi:hypothetical protein SAMN04487965_0086 [Microbulbifer donghaiensis]|uniref:Uncharacterized protein n=1 Tax=Microbulbifer donghaiensis TaxID=494016 RepID=A0A1M4U7V0_9GAMM|nr:hypothetical protein [Microbulbifer donghaiensis]SHE52852.1 hypothetical protein SAMN04487965_0086 [Microbulbifer donghaiensis]
MSVSSSSPGLQENALYRLAAAGAVLLSVLLILGANGHFVAIWAQVMSEATALPRRLLLMLPGAVLAGTAALNILFSQPLWQARGYALTATLAGNLLTMLYLIYLLIQGVPGHPIGVFLALEMSFVILLVAIRAGMVWPARTETAVHIKR